MNGNKIKMGRISYINASPVYYGLDAGLTPPWLELVTDVPAALNQKIISGEVQVSPISAAHYAKYHKNLLLLPDLSISCNGEVLSVICASRYPLEELDGKKVALSRESATGANLLKLILSQKKVSPEYITLDMNTISLDCQEADAVMVIGDKALSLPWKDHFPHVTDLGKAWQDMTGLPFVFAVWAADKTFAESHPEKIQRIIELLHTSRDDGYNAMEEIIPLGSKKLSLPEDLIRQYYQLLYCDMDKAKVQGMGLFFDSLFARGLLPEKVDIRFFQFHGNSDTQ